MSRSALREWFEWLRTPLAWDLLLAALTGVWSFVFIRLFAPGRMNVDIADQYQQATGTIPFTDWHAPVMSVVWGLLITVTGRPGSLLVLQVVMLAAAALIIGVIINRRGAPRWISLLGPVTMATPWVLSQLTTLWKDTQMAVALALAVALLAVTRMVPRTWVLWLPALVLLVYALGVRKNAVFALVPIAVYGAFCLRGRLRSVMRGGPRGRGGGRLRGGLRTAVDRAPRWCFAGLSVLVICVVGFGSVATEKLIESRVDVEHNGQISQIFLDDVMFSVPESRLQSSDAPRELRDHISSARDTCLDKGEIWDAYWNCYGRGTTGKAFSPLAYQDELKSLWLSEVVTHPVSYLEYRSAVFSYYFFSSKLEYWEADWDGDAEKVGYEAGSVKADFIFRPYVEDFALGTFPMLFKPWFWALVAAVLVGQAVRARRRDETVPGIRSATASTIASGPSMSPSAGSKLSHTPTFWPEITVLATSALCYIVGYFPIVPANHFRYTYWPALAVTFAFVLWLAERRIQRVRNIGP